MMKKFRCALAALGIASGVLLPAMTGPALAAVDASDPQRFIQTLTNDGFSAMRGGSRDAAKAKFRTMLSQHVAVDMIGDRLIRRWLPTITPAQKAAYKAAFPNFIIGTYADRLYDYSQADLKVIRTMPSAGGVDVVTQVTKPGGAPLMTVWSVQNTGGYKVTNLKVGGANLAISQAADFDAIVQRKGFDALVAMMKARG